MPTVSGGRYVFAIIGHDAHGDLGLNFVHVGLAERTRRHDVSGLAGLEVDNAIIPVVERYRIATHIIGLP